MNYELTRNSTSGFVVFKVGDNSDINNIAAKAPSPATPRGSGGGC